MALGGFLYIRFFSIKKSARSRCKLLLMILWLLLFAVIAVIAVGLVLTSLDYEGDFK